MTKLLPLALALMIAATGCADAKPRKHRRAKVRTTPAVAPMPMPWSVPFVGEFPISSAEFAAQFQHYVDFDLRPIEKAYLGRRVCWVGKIESRVPHNEQLAIRIPQTVGANGGARLAVFFEKNQFPEWTRLGDVVAVTGKVSSITSGSVFVDPESIVKVGGP